MESGGERSSHQRSLPSLPSSPSCLACRTGALCLQDTKFCFIRGTGGLASSKKWKARGACWPGKAGPRNPTAVVATVTTVGRRDRLDFHLASRPFATESGASAKPVWAL